MKLLVLFLAACIVLLGVFAWSIVRQRVADAPVPAPFSEKQPAVDESAEPASVTAVEPEAPVSPESAPSRSPVASRDSSEQRPADSMPAATRPATLPAMVRWAEDGTRKAALERLAAAREELRKDPEHERALRDALAALLELERWGEAADTLAPLAASHPEEPQLHAEQAALLIRARRWIDAVDVLRTLVAVHPDDAGAWFNLAVAHQALGHLADARRAWDRTIALSPTAPAYAQRGAVLLDQHDWEAAASDFATVLRDEPDAQDATLNLALALEKLGRRDEARDRLAAWLEHHPRDVPALNRLAELAWAAYQAVPKADRRRWCGEAADACRRSLEIDPRQPAIRDLLETAERAARAADQ